MAKATRSNKVIEAKNVDVKKDLPTEPKNEVPEKLPSTNLPDTQQKDKQEEKKRITPEMLFETNISKYQYSLLPKLLSQHNITPEQFINVTINEVKKNPKLLQCLRENPSSLFASILFGAEIGMMPSEGIGEFFIIPYSEKQKDNTYKMVAKPQIGYKGFVTLLHRSGDIIRINAEVVYKGDKFEYELGLDPKLIHVPDYNIARKSANITHVYCVAKLKSGESQFIIMSKAEVEAVRALSKTQNALYFNDEKDPNMWMVKKAAIKQLAKLLPKDYYAKKALEVDNEVEGGGFLVMDEETKQFKVVEGSKIVPKRMNGIYNMWDNKNKQIE
jgi:recombination protein RecT